MIKFDTTWLKLWAPYGLNKIIMQYFFIIGVSFSVILFSKNMSNSEEEENNRTITFARMRYEKVYTENFYRIEVDEIKIKNKVNRKLYKYEPKHVNDFQPNKYYWIPCPDSDEKPCPLKHDHDKDYIKANIIFLACKFFGLTLWHPF